jgi:hypothetical protein
MDATEILCSLLEERGVEWREHEAPAAECIAFFDGNGWHDCWESVGGEVNVTFSMTPEQAIAATLGRGECHDEGDPSDFCCSECGVRMFTDTSDTYTMIASDGRTIIEHPNYCPNCGRRIVGPTTNDVDAEVGA